MTEYVLVRASQVLDQDDLVAFLKLRFPKLAKPIGGPRLRGAECIEVRVPSNSPEFDEIRRFIVARRAQGEPSLVNFTIGRYLRKYTKAELRQAEVLRLYIRSHFEPAGEECGTIYETLCEHCNLGRQTSDLVLDLHRVPQRKDISETISWVEWVVSEKFVWALEGNRLTGAEFPPVFDLRKPLKPSTAWRQMRVTATAGKLAEATKLGRDPFLPSQVSWRCPEGHSVVAEFLSEVYLNRYEWSGADIAVTTDLLGQGRNLLRPVPLIIISQRMYRLLEASGLKGYSAEVAHLI